MHVNRLILAAFLEGDLSRAIFEEIVGDHLMELCPVCCREIEAFDWEELRGKVTGPDFYREPIERVRRRLPRMEALIENERKEARSWIGELAKHSSRDRRGKVRRAHSRFRGRLFITAAVEEAKANLPEAPAEALSWAEVAHEAFQRTGGLEHPTALHVLVLAVRGNAYRATGNLVAAHLDFVKLRKKIHRDEVLDLDLMAEIDSLEGSLRKDRREFEEAEMLLTRSAAFYRLLGETVCSAKVRMNLASVAYYQGASQRAITEITQAISDLGEAKSSSLFYFARCNLAVYLEDSGDYEAAEEILIEDSEEYEKTFSSLLKLRVEWTWAEIDQGRGKLSEAEERFLRVRDGFLEAQNGYDVAMVSLDLSALLLSQGRISEVKQIATETLALFSSQLVSREALAAFRLFAEAARQERISDALIRDTLHAMRRAPRLPLDMANPS